MTQVMKVTKSHGKKLDSHEHAQTCSGREHASEKNGILAQLGEHLPYKQGVTGSSPVGPIYTVRSINDKNEYADVAQFKLIDECQ